MLRPFLYDETTGVSESVHASESLHIYPNPASDHLYINIPGESSGAEIQVNLYDASGRLADRQVIQDGHMDVTHLAGGIYFLQLYSPGKIFHAKVVINR